MTSPQDQNLSMERAARVYSYDLLGFENVRVFGCWGRDCPCKFGELMTAPNYELWLHSSFVWSREKRLYLVPKSDLWEWKKPEREKNKERGANFNAEIDRFDFLEATEGKPVADRWAAQITGERFSKLRVRDAPKIKADGRRVRVSCPRCFKVSILSYHATGAANDSAQREQNQESGHPKQLLEPP